MSPMSTSDRADEMTRGGPSDDHDEVRSDGRAAVAITLLAAALLAYLAIFHVL